MVEQIKRISSFPFHPIVWGIYPIASLYLANIAELPVRAILPSVTFAVAVTILIPLIILASLAFWSTGREKKLLGLAFCEIALFVALYFPVYQILKNTSFQGMVIGRHRYLMPLWTTLCITALIYTFTPSALLSRLKSRDLWERAALTSSVSLILFFSYGHNINLAIGATDRQSTWGLHGTVLIIWGIIFIVSNRLLWKAQNKMALSQAANLLGGVLLSITMIQIGVWMVRSASSPESVALPNQPIQRPTASDDPDIYYIVLDGYGRSDNLFEDFDIDNAEFIGELKSMGFVFPECTQSNYHLTILSMTSSLNMEYLTTISPGPNENSTYLDFEPHLHQSRVLSFFEDLGYETFTFAGINPYTEIPNSTHFITTDSSAEQSVDIAALNFYYLFLQTTALRPLLDYLESPTKQATVLMPILKELVPSDTDLSNRQYFRYQQNLYHLKVLEGIPDLPGKKFVYAHLYMAHEPFVFTPEGEFRASSRQDKAAYADQIRFLNNRIPGILKKIISYSSTPPIIVIQADHGWGWNNRRDQILNAYYLPNGGNELVYPEITPVNTFRLVINKYFGGNYDLLPDVSYYAPSGDFQMKNLSILPNTCIPR